jgi:hypothetical protein
MQTKVNMNKETKLSREAKILIVSGFCLAITAILVILLKDTEYIKFVPYLMGMLWLIGVFFSGKFFIELLKSIFK